MFFKKKHHKRTGGHVMLNMYHVHSAIDVMNYALISIYIYL